MHGARPMRSTRRLQNLQATLPKWYSISNVVTGQPTQVSIYDEIGFFGVAAGEFMADLKAINGDIELHINSPGGDVHDGIAIYNQLKQRAGVVGVVIDGLAASAASFIAQAASPGKLEIAPHAQMMVHNGFSMGIGDAADLRKTADLLDTLTAEIASIYAERTGKPVSYWQSKMSAETWFTDKQAVAEGLADRIHGQDDGPDNSWDLSVFTHAGNSGAHDNSWPIEDATGDTDSDSSSWDGSKAMANGAASDDPAAFYAGICAGTKAGDKATQDAWALPYKYHPGDAPNAAGVKAALGRLDQTQGLTNKAEAKATLQRAMKQVNPDWEPEDHIDTGLLAGVFALALKGGSE